MFEFILVQLKCLILKKGQHVGSFRGQTYKVVQKLKRNLAQS